MKISHFAKIAFLVIGLASGCGIDARAQIVSEARENSAGVLLVKKGADLGFFFGPTQYAGAPQESATNDLLSGLKAYGLVDSGTEGASQITTAVASGTTTTSGTVTVTVTGLALTGTAQTTGTVTLNVAVSGSEAPALWAGQVEAAILSSTAISDFYSNVGTGANISLAAPPAANDSTFNLALSGTAIGISTVTTSTATQAGIAAGGSPPATPLNLNGGTLSAGILSLGGDAITAGTNTVALTGTSAGSLSIVISGTTYHIPYK